MKALILTSLLLLASVVAARSQGTNAIPITSGVPQLFVDDYLIAKQEGLERRLNCPTKDQGGNEAIIPAKPGTTLLAYGSIVYDSRLKQYVMFTQGFEERHMYRFTSKDGLTWDTGKGDFEIITFGPPPEKEADARGTPGIDVFSCYYDRRDSKYPYKGWMYYANYGPSGEGIYYVRSRDGRQWDRLGFVVNAWAGPGDTSARKIEQDGKTVYGPGDVTLFSYDALQDRFLGIFKFFTSEKVGEANSNLRSRAYKFLDSLEKPVDSFSIERIALLPPARKEGNDEPADEYYASTAWRYGSMWLGGLKIWHGLGDYPYSSNGCAFFKLVSSRDGLNWTKVPFTNTDGVPEVFVPNGRQGGNSGRNDGGYMSEFSQGPLRIGDELIYYYSSSSYGKNAPRPNRLMGGGVFRARLRVDGFVSVTGGTLLTKPLISTGSVYVNAVGPVSMAVLDTQGRTLGNARISGDSLEHRVRFDKGRLKLNQTTPVQLRFSVEPGGQLFSFTVK